MICKGSFVHNFSSSPIWKFWHSKEHLQNLRENLDDQHSVLTSCVTSERVPYNRSDKRSWFLKFQLDLTTLTGYHKNSEKFRAYDFPRLKNNIFWVSSFYFDPTQRTLTNGLVIKKTTAMSQPVFALTTVEMPPKCFFKKLFAMRLLWSFPTRWTAKRKINQKTPLIECFGNWSVNPWQYIFFRKWVLEKHFSHGEVSTEEGTKWFMSLWYHPPQDFKF